MSSSALSRYNSVREVRSARPIASKLLFARPLGTLLSRCQGTIWKVNSFVQLFEFAAEKNLDTACKMELVMKVKLSAESSTE